MQKETVVHKNLTLIMKPEQVQQMEALGKLLKRSKSNLIRFLVDREYNELIQKPN